MEKLSIPKISPKTRKALIQGSLLVSVLAIVARYIFGDSLSVGDMFSAVPVVVALLGLTGSPTRTRTEELTSFDPRAATLGGLVGGTLGGAILGLCYYWEFANEYQGRRVMVMSSMVVPYGALIGSVAAFTMALGVRAFSRIPIFGHWFAVSLGAPIGGALGSAAVGVWGGVFFGRQDLPLAHPWMIIGVGLLCAASIVGGVFAFEFAGSWKRLVLAEFAAFLIGSLLLVVGAILIDHDFIWRQLYRFARSDTPNLAIAGAMMGSIAGMLGGLLVCFTYYLYKAFGRNESDYNTVSRRNRRQASRVGNN